MQGDYPQFLALGLAPLAFGALTRLFAADHASLGRVVALAVTLAAILLTHNISALLLGPTLAAYTVILGLGAAPRSADRSDEERPAYASTPSDGTRSRWANWRPDVRSIIVRGPASTAVSRLAGAGAAAPLALGLTAFFWLPALAEQGLVQLDRLRTDDYDVRNSFIDLPTLLAPPRVVDQTAANPPLYLHLGWGELALALATVPLVLALWRAGRPSPKDRIGPAALVHFAFGWALLLASAAMTLPVSAPVWRRIPLLMYTQFPWRVLELSALALALLAGVAVHCALRLARRAGWLEKSPGLRTSALIGGALLLLVVPSLVYLYPSQPFLTYGNLTAADVTAFERNGGAIGTTSTGEYYSADVTDRPTAPLPANLGQVGRLDRTSLPAGATATFLGSAGYDETYAVQLPRPTTLRFALIRYAGWEVLSDGQATPTRASPGQGLLLADVPAGAHAITVRFADTPVRRLGWILAFATLAILVTVGLGAAARLLLLGARASRPRESPGSPGLERQVQRGGTALTLTLSQGERGPGLQPAVLPWPFKARTLARPHAPPGPRSLNLGWQGSALLGLGFAALIALRATGAAPYDAVFARQSPPDRVIGAGHATQVRLADQVALLGYDVDRAVVHPGDAVSLTLYWRALRPMDRDYRALAMIAEIQGKGLLAQDDRPHPGGIPTRMWATDHYVVDRHTILVPAGAPAQVYELQVALYDPTTLVRLQQEGTSGWVGQQIILEPLHVLAARPVDLTQYRSIGNPTFGGNITLLGYRVSSDHVGPGQTLELTLVWRSARPLGQDYTVFTHLIDGNQNQAAGDDSQPVRGRYPTSTWLAGEDVVDAHAIAIPPSLAPGRYHLAFGWYDAKTLRRLDATAPDWQGPRSQIDLDLPISVDAVP
jgi:hypothetical protein